MNKKELQGDLITEYLILGLCIFLTFMIGYFMFNLSDLGYSDGIDKIGGIVLCSIGIPVGVFLIVEEVKCIRKIHKRYKGE